MNSFGYEYFESATGPHVSASASTGPLVLGMGSGEESMDDAGGSDKRGNYSDGVMWVGSQASSALGHLMTGGTKGNEKGTTSSLGIAGDLSNSFCASSSTPFSYDEPYTSSATPSSTTTTRARALAPSARRNISSSASSFTAPPTSHPAFEVFPQIVKQATSQVDENLKQKSSTLKQKSTPLSRTNSANRLSLGNISHDTRVSSTSAIRKPRRHSPMLGARPRDRVVSDGDVSAVGSGREHRVGGDVKGKGRVRDGHSYSRDDVSTGVGDRGLGGDGDVQRAREVKAEAIEREAKRRRDMPPPALPPERVPPSTTSTATRQSLAKALPMPTTMAVLPRQQAPRPPFNTRPPVQHTYSNSQSAQEQPFLQPSQPPSSQYQTRPPPQPGHAIAAANAQRRASESRRPRPPAQTLSHAASSTTCAPRASQVPVHAGATMPAPALPSNALSAPQSGPPRPSQTIPPASQAQANPPPSQIKPPAPQAKVQAQPLALPRPSQPPRPPALGMRRASTFSSSGSQKAYAPFEFGSQKPAGASSLSSSSSFSSFSDGGSKSSFEGGPGGHHQGGTKPGVQGNSNSKAAYGIGGTGGGGLPGQASKPTYAVSTELPTKQKPFRPPLKARTKSTLALFEGYDFQTGERVKPPPSANASTLGSNETTAGVNGAARAASTSTGSSVASSTSMAMTSTPAFTSASRAQAVQRSGSGGGSGPTTPYSNSECLSASTSSTSSLTLSSGGRTPPLMTDTSPPESLRERGGVRMRMSPVTPVTAAGSAGCKMSGLGAVGMMGGKTKGGGTGKDEMEETLVLSSDPSDDSFGDFGWDDGELAEAGMAFD